jgi:MFS family permease
MRHRRSRPEPAPEPSGRPVGNELRRVVLGSLAILLVMAGGAYYSLPVYLQHLTADRGLPLDQVSAGTSVTFIVGAVVGLFVGRIVTGSDPRPTIVAGGVIGGVSVAAIGQVTEVWQAYCANAGMGIAFISCGAGPVTVAVLRHADPAARAATLALSSMGISMGGVVFSPIASYACNHFGFSVATPFLGLAVVVVVTLSVVLLMPPSPPPPRPEPVVAPAAAAYDVYPESAARDARLALPADIPYARAVRSRLMWLMVASNGLFFAAQIGSITHVVRLCSERGLGVSGVIVAVITGTAVAARFVASAALRRVPLWTWALVVFVCQGLALVVLALAQSTVAVLVGALLLGLAVGNAPVLTPLVVVETFGMLDYPRIFSLQQIVTSLGQGVGPVMISVIHDAAGGYRAGYLSVAGVNVLAIVLVVITGHYATQVSRPRPAASMGTA